MLDEDIYDGQVKKKPKDVFVVLGSLHPDGIISSELVTLVNTGHKPVVQPHSFWTKNIDSASSLLSTRDVL